MKDDLETIEGMKFDRGYISPYFMNSSKGMVQCILSKYPARNEVNQAKKSNVFHLKQTDKKIIQLKIFLSTSEYSRLLKSSCLQISVHLILAQITKENLFPLPTELSYES